ncbi:MAG: alpha/beta hydrolase [Parcubacteria group bacterium]|nr:alpha/beta hydrolase [Parcubacteria group bacterium]
MKTKGALIIIFLLITIIISLIITLRFMENKEEIKQVEVNGIEMSYQTFGQGEPLVMIMGFSGTMDLWPPAVINKLAQDYQVIIFDNRGMGYTEAGAEEFSIRLFADDTVALLEALGIEKAHVLGWSMGTYVAQELALNYPDKVNKLILYAADCGGEHVVDQKAEDLAKVTDTSGSEEERLERLLSALFPPEWLAANPNPAEYMPEVKEEATAENIARQAQAMEEWVSTYDRLPQIKQETLFIAGSQDIIPPPRNSFVMAEQIPASSVIQIKSSGHGLIFQYPEKFVDTVRYFLAN